MGVIATTRSSQKVDFLTSLGADKVLVGDFSDEVLIFTNGKGCDVVWDSAGAEKTISESIQCCKFGARMLLVGFSAGASTQIPLMSILAKGLQVLGCPSGIATKFDDSLAPRRNQILSEWMQSGKLP